MNKNSYMSKDELIKFLKIGVLVGELAIIANETKDKNWKRKMKCSVTYLEGIVMERILLLDRKQLDSVTRRKNNTTLIMRTEDQERAGTVEKEMVNVDLEDIETLTELALNSCLSCKEGLIVENCRFRKTFHKLGMPVCNCNPEAEKCEFKFNEVQND